MKVCLITVFHSSVTWNVVLICSILFRYVFPEKLFVCFRSEYGSTRIVRYVVCLLLLYWWILKYFNLVDYKPHYSECWVLWVVANTPLGVWVFVWVHHIRWQQLSRSSISSDVLLQTLVKCLESVLCFCLQKTCLSSCGKDRQSQQTQISRVQETCADPTVEVCILRVQ